MDLDESLLGLRVSIPIYPDTMYIENTDLSALLGLGDKTREVLMAATDGIPQPDWTIIIEQDSGMESPPAPWILVV